MWFNRFTIEQLSIYVVIRNLFLKIEIVASKLQQDSICLIDRENHIVPTFEYHSIQDMFTENTIIRRKIIPTS